MRYLLLLFLAFCGCAYPIRSCGAAVGWVQQVCADESYEECLLPFAKPIPPQGCSIVIDPHGPLERSVTCLASCERASRAR